jgi:hypothetical protein
MSETFYVPVSAADAELQIARSVAGVQENTQFLQRAIENQDSTRIESLQRQITRATQHQQQMFTQYPSLALTNPALASQLGYVAAGVAGVLGVAGALASPIPRDQGGVQETYPGSGIYLPPYTPTDSFSPNSRFAGYPYVGGFRRKARLYP